MVVLSTARGLASLATYNGSIMVVVMSTIVVVIDRLASITPALAVPSMRERWAIDRLNRSTGRVRDQALRANIITSARVRGQAWTARAGAVRAWKSKTLSASRGRSMITPLIIVQAATAAGKVWHPCHI